MNYGEFALLIIGITAVGVLSVWYRQELNALEDRIRDRLEERKKRCRQM